MLVDDDQDDIDLFAEALNEVNDKIQLVTAYNGQQALDLLLEGRVNPDFIFLDINMPIMNGIDCLRLLKAKRKFPPPVVTMYSTSGKDTAEYIECMKLGALFITKPATFQGLITAIQKQLSIAAT